MNTLIIGYGNTLRNDDGVGVKTAEAIEAKNWPDTRVITSHQLTPELAEDIAGVEQVIFVDATLSECVDTRLQPLETLTEGRTFGHAETPESLLAFTRSIYGKNPLAYGVYIPAVNCEFGEELSEVTRAGMDKAIALIETLILSD
jgi:hydrogenase maturation protease